MLTLLFSVGTTVITVGIALWCYLRLDPADPARRVASDVVFKARKVVLVIVVVLAVCFLIGIPHVRSKLIFAGPLARFAPPVAQAEGMYVSLSGWNHVEAETYPAGLPVIAFIPIHGCLDVSGWSSTPGISWLPQHYRDGDGSSWDADAFVPQSLITPETTTMAASQSPPVAGPQQVRGRRHIAEPENGHERRGIIDDAPQSPGPGVRGRRLIFFSPK